jgi:hypothetical protein
MVERWKTFVIVGKKEGLWLYRSKRRITRPQTSGRCRIDSATARRDGFAAEWMVCGRHIMVTKPRGRRRRGNANEENLTVTAEWGATRRGMVLNTGCTTLSPNAG